MKKAISYMMIGAVCVAASYMYMDKHCWLSCKMRKLKKAGMETMEKVKNIF